MTSPAAVPKSGGSRHVGRVVIALVAGLIVGILVARAGNPALSRAVAMLEPVGAIWVNGIRMTVVPLVVCWLPLRVWSLALKALVSQRAARALRQAPAPLTHNRLRRRASAMAGLASNWTGLRLWN